MHLGELTNVEYLSLNATQLGGAELRHLRGLTKLTTLHLQDNPITDSGLEQLCWLVSLQNVTLDSPESGITNAGLGHLKELTNLKTLSLDHAQITDAGLQHLGGLKNLESLFLYNTAVTPDGVELLQETLPHCRIEY